MRRIQNSQKEANVKKRKFNFLDIITIVIIVALIAVYAPRAINLYSERKNALAEANKPKVVEYPLEVEITEADTEFFSTFFKDYAVGITADVNFLDGISEKEMIEFCIATLSEKYSSSGVISKSSIENSLKKYFDVSDLDYKKLGYNSFNVHKEYKPQKIFNVTKLVQLEENGDMYSAYVDSLDIAKVTDGTYKNENVEKIYVFTFKKIDENTSATGNGVKYVLQSVTGNVEPQIEANEKK